MSKCPAELSHAIKCRIRKEGDFTELTTIFEEIVQSLYPPRKNFVPRSSEIETTAATTGTIVKAPIVAPERRSRACPKCNSTDPTHTWRTCKGKEINMIEDTPGDSEEGQLEFDFFNQDDSDPEELDVQARNMYEEEGNDDFDGYRFCNMMTIHDQTFIEPSFMKNMKNTPYLEISCSGIATHMLLDTGADMSFITLDILQKIWRTWETDMRDLDCLFLTANSKLPVLGGINLPITIRHASNPCILLLNFLVIENKGQSIMAMGADDFMKYEASINFGATTTCKFKGNETLYPTTNGLQKNMTL